MITYSVRFESADQADRAAARLRSRGILLQQYLTAPARQAREPGLIVGLPYSYPATTASPSYTTGLINGLPQTDGSTVILPMPFVQTPDRRGCDARFTVVDADAGRARRLLINCGGAGVQIVH